MSGSSTKRDRVNMRVPGDLLSWAKEHARSKNKSLTQLFVDYLTELKEKEDESKG